MSAFLPAVGQLARVRAGRLNIIAVVDGFDRGAVVLDVHGAPLPAGSARLSFNSAFGGVLLAGQLHIGERGARFWPNADGARFEQRRETFRVAVTLPVVIERTDGTRFPCETLDLSIGGAMLAIERPFAPADQLRVTIDCNDRQAVSLAATVVRSERGARRLAVAFANVGGTDERKLTVLVTAAQRRALTSR